MSNFTLLTRAIPADQLTRAQRAVGCVAFDKTVLPIYKYDPSLAPGIVFCVAFLLSMVAHGVHTSIKRKWWYLSFVLGALGELIGWAGRTTSHYCPYNKDMFSLQISILIISPCFFSAGIYYILGELIRKWGTQFSPVSPRSFLVLFIGADLISVIIQGTGGGLASSAFGKTPPGDTHIGTSIMMAGIIIQLVSMSVFALLWILTIWRARRIAFEKPMPKLLAATTISTACILVRNFYRAVELSQGWRGYLITHEVYFCVLDSALMVIAVTIFNIIHPAGYIGNETTKAIQERKEHDETIAPAYASDNPRM